MFHQFAQRTASAVAPRLTKSQSLFTSNFSTQSFINTKSSKFSQKPFTLSRYSFSTSADQSQTTITSQVTPTASISTSPPILKPSTSTWRNPMVFTIDAIFACTVVFLAVEVYNFIVHQPPIIDVIHAQAAQAPFMIENLGEPITRDWFWWGNITPYSARVEFGVSGPKGSGRVDAKGFKMSDEKWEMAYLHGILPQFGNRLTDLLPLDENDFNVYPYIPSPDDPSAAHALTGAPNFPYTPSSSSQSSPAESSNDIQTDTPYSPFERNPDAPEWKPTKVSYTQEELDYLNKLQLGREELDKIGSQVTHEFLQELQQYQSLTTQPLDGVTMREALHDHDESLASQQLAQNQPQQGYDLTELIGNRTNNSI